MLEYEFCLLLILKLEEANIKSPFEARLICVSAFLFSFLSVTCHGHLHPNSFVLLSPCFTVLLACLPCRTLDLLALSQKKEEITLSPVDCEAQAT